MDIRKGRERNYQRLQGGVWNITARRRRSEVVSVKLGEKVVFRVGRVRSHRSNRQDSALLKRCGIRAVSEIQQVMMSPVQRLQMEGGECHFRNMTVPRAGDGNRENAGTAHVKGPVSMACSWYLCLHQETECSMSCVVYAAHTEIKRCT